jgi:hypothetical protein
MLPARCLGMPTQAALELSECFFYLIHWRWKNGVPTMTPKTEMKVLPLTLTSGLSPEKTQISHKDVSESHLTLGVHLTPTGDMQAQYQQLLTKSNACAVNVLTSNLTRAEAYLAYRTTWIPSVIYSLSVTTLTCHQLEHIQMRATGHFLSKMVLNSHIPRAVAMGPIVMGGLALRSLPTEQGIQQTLTLMGHCITRQNWEK